MFAARLDGAQTLDYPIASQRRIYLQVARGRLQVNGYALSAGDALMFSDETVIALAAGQDAEVLLFDLA